MIGKATESVIAISSDPSLGVVVTKKYKTGVPCVEWLNRQLTRWYDPAKGLPVAQHEFTALQNLAPYGLAPKPLSLESDSIVMEFAGSPLSAESEISTEAYVQQCHVILETLRKLSFRHNDLLPRNVLIHEGRVKIIDFTLAEFNGVSLMKDLPDARWARPGQDERILNHLADLRSPPPAEKRSPWKRLRAKLGSLKRVILKGIDNTVGTLFPRTKLRSMARRVYNYHNLGVGVFPEGEEKTPFGSGERYNFDRMYMMVSNYDFDRKRMIDLGCNSGWFCVQAKLLGTGVTVGIDRANKGIMGEALRYAIQFERAFKLGIKFLDADLERLRFAEVTKRHGIARFDVALLLSVLHHIHEQDINQRRQFFVDLYDTVEDVIFYEDHEFWNDMLDANGNPIPVRGEGYRFGWNEDLSWQRKIHSLEVYGPRILNSYRSTWRQEVLMLDRFAEVRFLGFSEKRRPMFALFKRLP